MDAGIGIGCSRDSTRNTLGAFEAAPAHGADVTSSITVANPEAGETTRERRTITRGGLEPFPRGGGTEKHNSAAMRAALAGAGDTAWVSKP
jgi:hypothetical protein